MIQVYITKYNLRKGEKKYQVEHQKGLSLLGYGLKEKYCLNINEKEIKRKIKHGEHGKPFLDGYQDIHFNISHCDGLVACAFSDKPVGIDLERSADVKDSMVKRVLTQREQATLAGYKKNDADYKEIFYRFWTLKESYIKWDGSGFFKDPKEVSFEIRFGADHTSVQIQCSDPNVHFYQEHLKENVILSICKEKRMKQEINISWVCI